MRPIYSAYRAPTGPIDTVTTALCGGTLAKEMLSMNWVALLLVAPVLALLYSRGIRPWQLRWGATDEELARALPGDDLVARPTFNATRAVSIAAPPALVWPWLVQVGVTRAGWYSYDLPADAAELAAPPA
jgi:hypothetical protein